MENYIYEEKKVGNYTVKVVQDNDPMNPRIDFDNLGSMICFHNRYNLGDDHNYSIEECEEIYNDDNYISLPLYLYDHSGITISTSQFSCSWDSGQIGIITISKEKIKEEYSVKRISKKLKDRVIQYLINEVETYDQYLTGEVYGFQVFNKYDDVIDSCYGFYGDSKDCLNEGISIAKWLIKQDIKNHLQKLKTWIRNSVPLEKRHALDI